MGLPAKVLYQHGYKRNFAPKVLLYIFIKLNLLYLFWCMECLKSLQTHPCKTWWIVLMWKLQVIDFWRGVTFKSRYMDIGVGISLIYREKNKHSLKMFRLLDCLKMVYFVKPCSCLDHICQQRYWEHVSFKRPRFLTHRMWA